MTTPRALADWNDFIERRRLKREADDLRKRTQWLVLVVVAAVAVALGMAIMWWAMR